jgi:hypothetical protein
MAWPISLVFDKTSLKYALMRPQCLDRHQLVTKRVHAKQEGLQCVRSKDGWGAGRAKGADYRARRRVIDLRNHFPDIGLLKLPVGQSHPDSGNWLDTESLKQRTLDACERGACIDQGFDLGL